MKERPILFNAPMVRALLAGTKTQTRRIVKPVKFYPDFGCAVGQVGGAWEYGSPAALGLRERGDHWSVVLKGDVLQRMCTIEAYGWGAGAGCPYGVPGDQLWVRETWAEVPRHEPRTDEDLPWREDGRILVYAADLQWSGARQFLCADGVLRWAKPERWRPSIHMPRWASRITLEVTGVRVERLQDISEADAQAEGWTRRPEVSTDPQVHKEAARDWFMDLWESINGPGSWDENPWVWVIEFRRLP